MLSNIGFYVFTVVTSNKNLMSNSMLHFFSNFTNEKQLFVAIYLQLCTVLKRPSSKPQGQRQGWVMVKAEV